MSTDNNQKALNDLVSVHLGRAGDGTVVKPYVTPDSVDPSLLVAVPRQLNRTAYDLHDDSLPFVGCDAWNAYEFSTLLKNGFPISGWMKFVYGSDTPNIVESKSVKLYLNSFNMARLIEKTDDIWIIEDKVQSDLENAVGGIVQVSFVFGDERTSISPMRATFLTLEGYVDVHKMHFNNYNESSSILQLVDMSEKYTQRWHSFSLRSNCRVTNQPDWGDVFIHIRGERGVTPESLLQYIVSMRRENHFHEEICECIYKRLLDVCQPKELFVACLYTRRGGIDINPVRASSCELLSLTNIIDAGNHCEKTARQ